MISTSRRLVVEDCFRLNISQVVALPGVRGRLNTAGLHVDGGFTVSFDIDAPDLGPRRVTVQLTTTAQRRGNRAWLRCPTCHRCRENLYLAPDGAGAFTCRCCLGLAYASQRERVGTWRWFLRNAFWQREDLPGRRRRPLSVILKVIGVTALMADRSDGRGVAR